MRCYAPQRTGEKGLHTENLALFLFSNLQTLGPVEKKTLGVQEGLNMSQIVLIAANEIRVSCVLMLPTNLFMLSSVGFL